MPRKKRGSLKRDVIPDPRYNDAVVSKLVNTLMMGGKKGVAETIVYGAFDVLHEKKKDDPVKVFRQALDSLKPNVEVRSRRVGGATYQVPVEVRSDRRATLALRWLVAAARARGEGSMGERLAGELLDVLEQRGGAFKKREDTHRMAEANKAFAHFKW
ncbi:MAG: 30S ribosomal protein S7 [Deltaproteobacteria bacterium CG_4_10_14_0_2_um_filter_43_8]|nr:MAG: 30S ribosomal protein S7 [Deltaproteobacteria bacterium CG11_big_fil_rev_8_21_14_0_20_42_23]PJA21632.1 MAG: 30S ribosomal protein S7 [Deltaproteobacteria bacterium CG_4_10_14_0_2_um_filter_43_8]PJC63950.1 MAG: 30S ribosomal protein S7 [Deltaproteobacteria bacterium CG_4_9_14_0_2_um_filter_42_21]